MIKIYIKLIQMILWDADVGEVVTKMQLAGDPLCTGSRNQD